MPEPKSSSSKKPLFAKTTSFPDAMAREMRMAQELHEIKSRLMLVYPITEAEALEKNVPTHIKSGQLQIDGAALSALVEIAYQTNDLTILPNVLGLHEALMSVWNHQKLKAELLNRDTIPEREGLTVADIERARAAQETTPSQGIRVPTKPKLQELAATIAYTRDDLKHLGIQPNDDE
jgi:hypothetical protein